MLHSISLCVALAATLPIPLLPPVETDEQANARRDAPHFRLNASTPDATVPAKDAEAIPAHDLLPLAASRAEVSVVGGIAEVRVMQTWVSASTNVLSADYIFPAPTGAAVTGMTLQIGERFIRADVKERHDAAEVYAQAVATGQTAALLEEERPNVFRMRVGNIQPDDIIDVELTYSEQLRIVDGEYEVVMPRAVGARYGGALNPARAATMTHTNPFVGDANNNHHWAVDVLLQTPIPLSSVSSTTHTISPEFRGKEEAWIRVTSDSPDAPKNTDFVLRFSLLQNVIAQGVRLYRDPDHGENYFMMTLAPPKIVKPREVASREVIFVVDVSGSMSGEPTEIVHLTMKRLLRDLRPRDRFNLMTFAGSAATWKPQSVRATAKNLASAFRFLTRGGGGGGTELKDALTRAEQLPGKQVGVSRSFVLLSDGFISADQELIHYIHNHRSDFTLFAMGIGRGPNRYLIEGLARASGAEPFFAPNLKAAGRVADRFARVATTPALVDIDIDFDGFDAYDVAPTHIGELYAGRPITILGKYRGAAAGEIHVRGHAGKRTHEGVVVVQDNHERPDNRSLRALWARARIAELVDYKKPDADSRAEVLALGLEHHMLTPFTSFVAVDTARKAKPKHGATEEDRGSLRPRTHAVPGQAMASGGLLGSAVGSAQGRGGLGLTGTGAGGGGIGIGKVGTRSKGGGGAGYGRGVGVNNPLGGSGRGGIDLGGRGKGYTRIRPGKVTYRGALSRAEIQRVMRRVKSQMHHCYDKAYVKDNSLRGNVTIQFVITGSGLVKDAEVKKNTVSEAVGKCIAGIAGRLRFPKPRGGGDVVVVYPIVLTPS